MISHLDALRALVRRHAGVPRQVLPQLGMQIGACPGQERETYAPTLFFMVQGSKRLFADDEVLQACEGGHVYGSVDLPSVGEAIACPADSPFMGLALTIDVAIVADLILSLPPRIREEPVRPGVMIRPLTPDLLEPLTRLARLLDSPDDIPVMAPLLERELLYRALLGPHGSWLRGVSRSGTRIAQIRRAIEQVRAHASEPLRVEGLAALAGMSASSFHRHFKALTGLSPLQYQKQVRLQEARRRLITEPSEVANVAYAVGYQSVTQFTREYARQFGLPPVRDARKVRGDPSASSP